MKPSLQHSRDNLAPYCFRNDGTKSLVCFSTGLCWHQRSLLKSRLSMIEKFSLLHYVNPQRASQAREAFIRSHPLARKHTANFLKLEPSPVLKITLLVSSPSVVALAIKTVAILQRHTSPDRYMCYRPNASNRTLLSLNITY
jgi:hypothetical protein